MSHRSELCTQRRVLLQNKCELLAASLPGGPNEWMKILLFLIMASNNLTISLCKDLRKRAIPDSVLTEVRLMHTEFFAVKPRPSVNILNDCRCHLRISTDDFEKTTQQLQSAQRQPFGELKQLLGKGVQFLTERYHMHHLHRIHGINLCVYVFPKMSNAQGLWAMMDWGSQRVQELCRMRHSIFDLFMITVINQQTWLLADESILALIRATWVSDIMIHRHQLLSRVIIAPQIVYLHQKYRVMENSPYINQFSRLVITTLLRMITPHAAATAPSMEDPLNGKHTKRIHQVIDLIDLMNEDELRLEFRRLRTTGVMAGSMLYGCVSMLAADTFAKSMDKLTMIMILAVFWEHGGTEANYSITRRYLKSQVDATSAIIQINDLIALDICNLASDPMNCMDRVTRLRLLCSILLDVHHLPPTARFTGCIPPLTTTSYQLLERNINEHSSLLTSEPSRCPATNRPLVGGLARMVSELEWHLLGDEQVDPFTAKLPSELYLRQMPKGSSVDLLRYTNGQQAMVDGSQARPPAVVIDPMGHMIDYSQMFFSAVTPSAPTLHTSIGCIGDVTERSYPANSLRSPEAAKREDDFWTVCALNLHQHGSPPWTPTEMTSIFRVKTDFQIRYIQSVKYKRIKTTS